MNSKRCTRIIALTLFAALASPVLLMAQAKTKQHHPHQYHHYQLINPGTLGGPVSYISSSPEEKMINSRGAMEFLADTSFPDPLAPNCFNPDYFVFNDVI